MKPSARLIACVLFAFLVTREASASRPERRSWTVLVYWAVDNDLEEFSRPFLQRLEAGASDSTHVIVELDHEGPTPTERIEVRPDTGPLLRESRDLPHSRVVESLGETDSADESTLTRFLRWGASRYPADHYAVILASHGANWRGFAEDRASSRMIPLDGVARALRGMAGVTAKPADLVVFDACRMAFLETLFALQGTARLLVASQFDLNGFDHRAALEKIARTPTLGPLELGREYVRTYPLLYPAEKEYGASLLSLDPALVRESVAAIEARARELSTARSSVNEYGDRAFEVQAPTVLFEADTEGSRHSGLSINCPARGERRAYAATHFGREVPKWFRFCRAPLTLKP